jgi:UDP-2-acetamido-2-deoxy-ribo-hexuluronate aminotransferase
MQFIDLKKQYITHKAAIDKALENCLNDSKFIQGPEVKRFEEDLSQYVGSHALSCANGTDALFIALKTLEIGPGDEVIVPSFTWVSTVQVVKQVGANPVFADISPETFNLDVHDVKSKITDRTKAVIPVSIFGQCAELNDFIQLKKDFNIKIIEDAAQSFGAKHHGQLSCSIADISTTSFFPAKPLGCYGDGGAIFSNNEQLIYKANLFSKNGQSKRYSYHEVGINSRLDTLQAAILIEKLKIYDEEISLRNQIAQEYEDGFSDINFVTSPHIEKYNESVWAQYTLKLDQDINREHFIEYLQKNSIPINLYYPVPIHKTSPYFDSIYLQNTEYISDRVFSIPMHPYLKQEDINKVVEAIKNYENQR